MKTKIIFGTIAIATALLLTGCSGTPNTPVENTSSPVPVQTDINPADIKIQPIEMPKPNMLKLADIANTAVNVKTTDWIVLDTAPNLKDWTCSTSNEEVAVCSQSTNPDIPEAVMLTTIQRFQVGSTTATMTNNVTGEVVNFTIQVS